ncbi:MAG: aldehyde dehydrogenase family protein [Pseudomonadota bacterium]
MSNQRKFFINGEWVNPEPGGSLFDVIHPGNEEVVATIAMGTQADIDKAVRSAREAFKTWQFSTVEERASLLERINALYKSKYEAFSQAMSLEMGTSISFCREVQTPCGDGHIEATIEALKAHQFERPSLRGGSTLIDEPVGVCGLITPWNWPVNQVIVKVAPAIAAGCTMVLKPSEFSPLSAIMLAEIIEEADCPPGVFNLVNGDGQGAGSAMTNHPGIDMISFTGSTRAGIAISKSAADTVKKVALELGGKSPNIVFADADIESVAPVALDACFNNNGQSCDAGSRLLVERSVYDEVVERITDAVQNTKVDDPMKDGEHLGPVVNRKQFDNIQRLINAAIDEGTALTAGGPGLPDGFNRGYYIRPTVFKDVTNDMTIAREEVFGPVIAIMPFETEQEAIEIANDTPYGLAAYIQSGDQERVRRVAKQLRAGSVNVNGAAADYDVPFGGYKQSGNGKENGAFALEEYLETKALNI